MCQNKVAILTLTDYNNFGNRLQNYATEKTIEDLGYEVDTIPIELTPLKKNPKNFLKKINIKQYYIYIYRIKLIILKQIFKTKFRKKRKIFQEFTQNFMNSTSDRIIDEYKGNLLQEKYDFFVVGSDQVWNPNYIGEKTIYFLDFVNKEKRIAYAASFGINKLPIKYKKIYSGYIKEIKNISIREKSGAEIIKEITGEDVDILLDPTMVVNKKHWELISDKSKINCEEKYIFVYFLGAIQRKNQKHIKQIAAKYNLSIIDVMNPANEKYFMIGPLEFLKLIRNAELVYTDSFHGAVFSIIFEKAFIVAERVLLGDAMSTRTDTLLQKFALSDRKYHDKLREDELFQVDYNEVRKILDSEKTKNIMFLKKSLILRNGEN